LLLFILFDSTVQVSYFIFYFLDFSKKKRVFFGGFIVFFQHFENRSTIYSYFDFGLKNAVFGCLTNALAPLPKALESC